MNAAFNTSRCRTSLALARAIGVRARAVGAFGVPAGAPAGTEP